MEHTELNIKAEKLWETMSQVEKLNLLSENRFGEGLNVYYYEYIPEDLKTILKRRIEDNDPQKA